LTNLLNDITVHTEALERDIADEQRSNAAVLVHPTATRLSSIPDLPSTDSNSSVPNNSSYPVDNNQGVVEYPTTPTSPKNIGSVVRDVGTGIVFASKKTGKKISEINEKYGITQKIGNAANATKNKIVEVNENYHITDKAKGAVIYSYTSIKNANEKYHITKNIAHGCKFAVDKIGSVISKVIKLPSEGNTSPESANLLVV
jgi:hypothetical protein